MSKLSSAGKAASAVSKAGAKAASKATSKASGKSKFGGVIGRLVDEGKITEREARQILGLTAKDAAGVVRDMNKGGAVRRKPAARKPAARK